MKVTTHVTVAPQNSIGWTLRTLALAVACGGCGPAPFAVQLLAPAAVPARTIADTARPRDCPGGCLASGAPVVTCSLSDAVGRLRTRS